MTSERVEAAEALSARVTELERVVGVAMAVLAEEAKG
jgi:hypothetical protein